MKRGMRFDLSTPDGRASFDQIVANMRQHGQRPVFELVQERRSIDQNALYQIWARQYACHLLKKPTATEAEHEAMKYTLQRHCYAETGWPFLIGEKRDLFTGEVKPDRASTSGFDKGEMHQFLSWVQMKAAGDGLILESLGEYQQLQREQVA